MCSNILLQQKLRRPAGRIRELRNEPMKCSSIGVFHEGEELGPIGFRELLQLEAHRIGVGRLGVDEWHEKRADVPRKPLGEAAHRGRPGQLAQGTSNYDLTSLVRHPSN